MDNNSNNNNNVSGISNVSDIKFTDTPAESFENLYGGANQQPVANVGVSVNQGPSMIPNPEMVSNVNQGPVMTPNPGMETPVSSTPNVAPSVETPVTPMSNVASPVETPVTPMPNVAPSVETPVAPMPNVAPTVEIPVTPMSNVAPTVETPVTPNAGTIIQQPVEDLSDMDIDDQKMQSIEEQLSKTSQYNPADFQQEQITIPTDDQYEKNKSGLAFVVVLFIILALVIAFLPQITKLIK